MNWPAPRVRDRGGPSPILTQWLDSGGNTMRGDVLVPGCGLGYDAAAIARRGKADSVLGVDIVPAAIGREEATHRAPGLRFRVADFFGIKSGTCDWIVEHTCYSAIDPERRRDYVDAAWRALRPGGRLLAVFFLTPWDPGEDQDQGPPFATSEADLDARFGDRFELLESRVPTVGYPAGRAASSSGSWRGILERVPGD